MPNLRLAMLLALGVLRFHSTPWLRSDLQSRDVVFFGTQESLGEPYLKSQVTTRTSSMNSEVASALLSIDQSIDLNSQSPINQTLHSLGVMLVEIAYKARLEDLWVPEDDQDGLNVQHRIASRLGNRLWRHLGPNYAHAVNMCLHTSFAASEQLGDTRVQRIFFAEVVEKLEKCVESQRDL